MAREIGDYVDSLGRMIRAAGRRTGEVGDEPELAKLAGLQAKVDEALQTAVDGMRDRGMSWAYVAMGLGITRQAAQQRFGK